MDIKQIGLIERIFKPKKNQPIKQSTPTQKVDQVNLSSSAINRFKAVADEKAKEIIMNAPDVRIDKINSVREKLKQDDYIKTINPEILVEKILRSPFGFHIKPL